MRRSPAWPCLFLYAVLLGAHSANGAEPAAVPPGEINALLAGVSPERLAATVTTLAGFGTRHTLSDTESPTRGIGAARNWIKAQFEESARASGRSGDLAPLVKFDSHRLEPDGRRVSRAVDIVNVVAELPGARPEARSRRIYVIAHYDSRASDPVDDKSDAPGANDNASGTALVMELFRVLAPRRFDATLVFMATAGEEQGLLGARAHAVAAKAAGAEIVAVLNNDIVGDPSGLAGTRQDRAVRVFSEGVPRNPTPEALAAIQSVSGESDSPSRQLARYVAEAAAEHQLAVTPQLIFRPDRFLRGGDHSAFNDNGFPAVRFTVVSEHYHRQHQDVRTADGVAYGDLPEFVAGDYLAGVARVNGAALIHLANAPAAPRQAAIVTASLDTATTLRWQASPDADLAGYQVVWRDTTSPTWQHSRDVGAVTTATLPLSKDDFQLAVRAVDRDGYRSVVGFPSVARQ